jgi:uncharacterized protein YbjT (DUF2867 family)
MVLITTAGKVGSEASRLLAEQGVPVRVIARHPEQAASLGTVGVDVFKGDCKSRQPSTRPCRASLMSCS